MVYFVPFGISRDLRARFQIIAIYDEQGAPPVPHNGGDGTSASSVGTSSPDIFQSGEPLDARHFNGVFRGPSENDVIITHNDINVGESTSKKKIQVNFFFLFLFFSNLIFVCVSF